MSMVVAIHSGREAGIVGQIEGDLLAIQATAKSWKCVALRTFMAFPRTCRFVRVSRLRVATDHERMLFEDILEMQGGLFGDERTHKLRLTPRAERRVKNGGRP
jgi:hypothetical protein